MVGQRQDTDGERTKNGSSTTHLVPETGSQIRHDCLVSLEVVCEIVL